MCLFMNFFNSSLIICRFYFFDYSNYGFIDRHLENVWKRNNTFRPEDGQKLSIRVTPTMNDLWLPSAAYDSIYRYRPRTTLKLASLFASQILAKLLIGNTRNWIRCIIDLPVKRIPLKNKFHAARKVDKVTSEWNVMDRSQTMVYNNIIY